jgi:hypothetical protein
MLHQFAHHGTPTKGNSIASLKCCVIPRRLALKKICHAILRIIALAFVSFRF